MADLKISQLSDGGNSQATDEYVIARSGANYRIDGASIAAAATSVGTLSSLTVSGDLTVDTSTLKVDSANNRVGIGTASPSVRLDVQDTATVMRLRSTSGTAANEPTLKFFHDTNDEFDIRGGDGLKFYGSGTNLRMTLTGSGNLGLGVTPTQRLHVSKAGTLATLIENTSNSQASYVEVKNTAGSSYLGQDATGGYIGNTYSAPFLFYTNNAERARITSGGYFKASNNGTYIEAAGSYHEIRSNQADAEALVVESTSTTFTNAVFRVYANRNTTNNTFYAIDYRNSAAAAFRFRVADSGDVTNTNGSYTAISDAKLKQDIIDAPSQWDDIKATRFRKYRFKADVERLGDDAPYLLGVVAQELEQTSPGCIDEHPDYEEHEVTDEDGNVTTERVKVGSTKSFKQSVYLMKAAVALQEAMARIEALEVEVAALKAGA